MQTSRDGVMVVEQFFGQPVSTELLELIESAPHEHLGFLAAQVRDEFRHEVESPEGGGWKEFATAGAVDEFSQDLVVSDSFLLDHSSPAASRPRLLEYLLTAPRIGLADPVRYWAADADAEAHEWVAGERRSKKQELVTALSGLAPLIPLLEKGDVKLLRPPVEVSIDGNRAQANPTTRPLLYEALRKWGTRDDGHFSLAELDWWLPGDNLYQQLSKHIFPLEHQTASNVKRAIFLDDYAALNELQAAPSSALFPFFDSPAVLGEVAPALALDLPLMKLSLPEVLKIRASDEVFLAVRETLSDVIRATAVVGGSGSPTEYARAVRAAGVDILTDLEEKLQVLKRNAWFVSRALPGAVRLSVNAGVKLAQLPTPGAGAAAGAAARWSLKSARARYDAAASALEMTTNLRLTGYA